MLVGKSKHAVTFAARDSKARERFVFEMEEKVGEGGGGDVEERIKEGTGLKEGAQHVATQLRTLSGALCEELSWLRPLHLQQVSYSQRIFEAKLARLQAVP